MTTREEKNLRRLPESVTEYQAMVIQIRRDHKVAVLKVAAGFVLLAILVVGLFAFVAIVPQAVTDVLVPR